jgi:segregation and condensation protein A
MLLPKPAEIEEEDETDPRAELVMRLLEYQKYRDAAERLSGLEWLGRDVHGRAPEELPSAAADAPLREVGVFALIEAFDAMLARQKPEHRHQVRLEAVSVKQRMVAIVQHLAEHEAARFEELFAGQVGRIDIVITFLAILEMTKMRLLAIYQSEGNVLYLKPRFEDADAAMSRLSGLDLTYQG